MNLNPITSKLYLASKSPRRSQLLTQMGLDFEVLNLDTPEERAINESPLEYSFRVSQDKAINAWHYALKENLPIYPILTADTEVVYGDLILGKPSNYQEAFEMWQKHAASSHLVLTSVTLKYYDFMHTKISESWVYFDEISEVEIHNYLKTGDYIDKSGAYGIHSYAGQFINRIEGSFDAIMGLPLNLVRHLLSELQTDAKQIRNLPRK